MKISTKIRYGLRVMLHIAIEGRKEPVMARSIAEQQGVSEPYIDQLLIPLRTGGLVRSFRGRRGGYQLATDPRSLTVLDIVEVLDGRLSIVECLERKGCDRQSVCATRVVWSNAEKALRQSLSSMTLQDLCELDKRFKAAPEYVI